MELLTSFKDNMPEGLLRVPHGWWKPEMERSGAILSSARDHADARICPDDDFLYGEQGTPHFNGVPSRINRIEAVETAE